ncbi:MAG: hypothetical protein JSR29_06085 [Nitrospira sp.]|nr:hypothetical protein [Nitrospira sp.]
MEVLLLVPVGRHQDCRIESHVVEDQSVLNCLDPLERLPQGVLQVSSRLFAEWAVKVSRVKEKTSEVEAGVRKKLV